MSKGAFIVPFLLRLIMRKNTEAMKIPAKADPTPIPTAPPTVTGFVFTFAFAGAIITFIWALTDLGTPLLIGFHDTMPVRIFNMVTDINQNPVGFALVFIVIVMTVSFFLISKH
jgi:hypothetical protein